MRACFLVPFSRSLSRSLQPFLSLGHACQTCWRPFWLASRLFQALSATSELTVAFFKAASRFSMSAEEETGWLVAGQTIGRPAFSPSEVVPLPAAPFLLFSILFQGTNKKQLFQGFFKPFSRQPFSRQEGGKQKSERCLLVCAAVKLWTCGISC